MKNLVRVLVVVFAVPSRPANRRLSALSPRL